MSAERRLIFPSRRERMLLAAVLCAGCGQDVPLLDAEVCGACFAASFGGF